MKKIFTLLLAGAFISLGAQILPNGSFENWTDGSPDGWMGSKTNFSEGGVYESSDAQDGSKSVGLINVGSGHKRFTSQGLNLDANTSYTLTYYVKGEGEIRNSFFNGNPDSSGGGFAAYTQYTDATSDWSQITYIFETDDDVTDFEIIFSLRNSSEDGVLVDNAVLSTGGEVEIVEVATVADLRNGDPNGTIYRLTGDALMTFKQNNRNQKYFQDNTGGVLVDDAAGRLPDYEIGDMVTGLTGTIVPYNELIQFVPSEDGTSLVSSGNTVEPVNLDLSDYLADPVTYESVLISINSLMIDDADGGDGTFHTGTSYTLHNGDGEIEGRTQFFDVDLIGASFEENHPYLLTGMGGRFNQTIQLFLLDMEDELGVSDLNANQVQLTSVWTEEATFVTEGKAGVEIYNLNGQLVQRAAGNNTFTLNVSNLEKGVYIVKMNVNGTISTHKVVKK